MKGGKPDSLVIPALEEMAARPSLSVAWCKEEDAIIERYYGRGQVTLHAIAEAIRERCGVVRTPDSLMKRASKLRQMGRDVPLYRRPA